MASRRCTRADKNCSGEPFRWEAAGAGRCFRSRSRSQAWPGDRRSRERRYSTPYWFCTATAEANVGQEITVVGVAQRAREHRGRMIRDAAAICSQYQIEGNDSALIVETDVVTKQ